MRLAWLCFLLLLPIGGCATSWLPVLTVHAAITATRRVAPGGLTGLPADMRSTRSLRSVVGVSTVWSTTPSPSPARVQRAGVDIGIPPHPVCDGSPLCAWERRGRIDALVALGATP